MSQTKEMEYRASHPGCIRMYDIQLDDFRDVTQRDIDLLTKAATNWGSAKQGIEELAASVAGMHQRYMEHVRTINGNSGSGE
jgi:hypothetical protein